MNTEINRILKLFADIQHGENRSGTNFKEILHGVLHSKAIFKLSSGTNSSWEIISHVIYWRVKTANRLKGNDTPPPFIDFRLPEELNETTWKQTLIDFEASYHTLRNAIHSFKDENLDKPSPKEGKSFYQLMMECLQHDMYHLGQLTLLKKVGGHAA